MYKEKNVGMGQLPYMVLNSPPILFCSFCTMEPAEEPPAKKKKNSYEDRCIFCEGSLTKVRGDNPVVANPTIDGLKSILSAANNRQDDVFTRLSPIADDILNKNIKIRYHQKCRANYNAKRTSCYARKRAAVSDDKNETLPGLPRLRRLDTSKFNVRTDCFVCGSSYERKEKLTEIAVGTGESTRRHVLDAAIERNDEEIKTRMLWHTLTSLQWMQSTIAPVTRITSVTTTSKLQNERCKTLMNSLMMT